MSVITLSEVNKGIELLGKGKKKEKLRIWFEEVMGVFGDKIIKIDQSEALLAGRIEAHKKLLGFNVSLADCLIAATALKHEMVVVTRNEKDFKKLNCITLNPWL